MMDLSAWVMVYVSAMGLGAILVVGWVESKVFWFLAPPAAGLVILWLSMALHWEGFT